MKRRGVRISLPVVVVMLVIGFIYFSTVFTFIDRWFSLTSSPGIANAAVFTALALMCVYNYAIAIFRDPGWVPANYAPDVEDPENPVHEIKRKGGDLRYCQKCSHYKPPRAHHCRVCKRCVLRMDHHCIWINNCVGHTNYKAFFIFVIYAVTSCVYSLVMLVGSLTVETHDDEEELGGYLRTTHIVSALLLFPLSIALSVLLGWHIYLILQNKTTIEYHEGVRAMWLAEKGGQVYKHPYDIGAYENLTTVLGPNILCWLCPVSRHIGSGLRFRTAYDSILVSSESK
ncbi:PREDICTED: probable protein S-acyltransferase 16 [Tarenaya hassleriana]|uniref:probable protein S-acyltransferase 16 n=1 Tax=Tarenaya hassleriana TaxID=28532 RepID=UPI00053CA57E|nr:PREDICTED: probable protein S-acyltransferase 16 [Tarenaya hassleriana]